ncbi:2-keto-3-deoxy-D-arabino-heptulosonate-7-phosphate synthase I beta [Candidatus Syntrophocurvum alkaliphilum]|uniref:2-keto-3-deoxy-D-arabino-heptulosonate-7-phosphate synthase I beta n=1 Tax=Candidatus Syntrophocurvum alkaliphilum TaxID=2293317 RepID=A0A6I6DGF5_9FIRM|nr:3-deoxy-7-phosphoheptulonate synthase [Candidatus Syntrophocurvum alkaliphilum]QGU00088.1 2-keto-3-deoxy-D-arabino-heptulosonate-7-phosphate synthase I beta [Candidatus Syntrophocurvum alkaliphilum]
MGEYKLASKEKLNQNTIIKIKDTLIGEGYCTIIAGPCAIESRDNYLEIAQILKEIGVDMLRGGAFKPRTSPYSFQGMGKEGLQIIYEAKMLTNLPAVTEVLDVRDIDYVYKYCDIIQIGSRNMQNFSLLKEVGKIDKPVIVKRGLSATIDEWLLAAEYVLNMGNEQVILCERGIRTFETLTRNTVDIGAVSLIKELSHLPILVDPSHATGKRSIIKPVAKAALAAGADGIMVEVHQKPEDALSDGSQSLTPKEYKSLYLELTKFSHLENKQIN